MNEYVAGEDIKRGDAVTLGEDGKVYRTPSQTVAEQIDQAKRDYPWTEVSWDPERGIIHKVTYRI